MNLLVRSNSYLWQRGHRVLHLQLVSTHALSCSFSSSSAPSDSLSLQSRISKAVAEDPSVSIVPILEKWIEEGRLVKSFHLQNSMSMLRGKTRYNHALQLSDWMVEKSGHTFLAEDAAIRLDLISRVHGLEEAEKYFNSINLQDYRIYNALLHCYVNAKQMEKAEAMMQRMKDMVFISGPSPYNEMLNLYFKMRKFEKLEVLAQEMEEKGINFSKATYIIRLNAYVACSDIEGMEKLLTKMAADPHIKMDFDGYSVAANGYMKAGLIDKTVMMLEKAEQLISNSRRSNYEILLQQYAAIGKKADVYRIWNMYKKMEKQFNSGYLGMISSLVKMDDMDGAEMIYEDWESWYKDFDIRIPNSMIRAYSKKGSWEKAEQYINKIVKSGKEPNLLSWDNLAVAYLEGGQMMKAVEAVKKAILTSTPGRIPRFGSMTTCLQYLKGQGEKEAADELLKMINEQSRFPTVTSWVHLAAGYLLNGHITKATEMVTKAVLVSTTEQQPKFDTLAGFLKHLKSEGDKAAAEELLKKIDQHCHFSKDTYNKLVSCIDDEKLTSRELQQMEDDDLVFGQSVAG